MGDGDARTHFHFTYFEISFGQFHSVIRIIDVRHYAKLVDVAIQNDFEINKTQQETQQQTLRV